MDHFIFLIGAIFGIILVFFPNLSTRVANWLGIGRGVDLLFYLFIIFNLFFWVSAISKNRRTEKRITRIVRFIALTNPLRGEHFDERETENYN